MPARRLCELALIAIFMMVAGPRPTGAGGQSRHTGHPGSQSLAGEERKAGTGGAGGTRRTSP